MKSFLSIRVQKKKKEKLHRVDIYEKVEAVCEH